eukprot:10181766-Heterocapsa_arctica.AAC.1
MAEGKEAPNNYSIILLKITTQKGETKYGYVFYQDMGNLTYARWLDSAKEMKQRSWLNDGKMGDLVEAMLGMGWIYGQNTQVTELDFVKKMVPYIEQGLMEY